MKSATSPACNRHVSKPNQSVIPILQVQSHNTHLLRLPRSPFQIRRQLHRARERDARRRARAQYRAHVAAVCIARDLRAVHSEGTRGEVGRDERVAASLPFQYLASHVPAVHVMRYALMISQVGLVGPEKPSHTTAVAIDGANYYIRLS